MERILALDLASRVGWAHSCDPAGVRTGANSFAPPTSAKAKREWRPGHRWMAFSAWIAAELDQLKPELIVKEAALIRHLGAAAAEIAFGLSSRVEEAAAARGIPVRDVHPNTLKAWAANDGHADKATMVAAAQRLFSGVFTSDDEADAACLLAYALAGFPEAPKKPRASKRKPAPKAQATLI